MHAPPLLRAYVILLVFFLLSPIVISMSLAFSDSARLAFPPEGFSLRWFEAAYRNPFFLQSLSLSLVIGLTASALAAVGGTMAAIAINHFRFKGRTLIQVLVLLPLTLPAIVIGLGVLFAAPTYGMRTGTLLTTFAHAVICMPYVAYLVLATLANYDLTLEQASINLGASRWRTFWEITFPLIRPGVIAGTVFAFLISFDNVSLSLFTARGDTLPLRLMQHIQFQADPTVAAISIVMVVSSVAILFLFGRLLRQRQLSSLERATQQS